jgi:hypothetical protein
VTNNRLSHCADLVDWDELAPSAHLMQVYEGDDALIRPLGDFMASGLRRGESVIAIATHPHLTMLENRLLADGFDVYSLRATDQYMPLGAASTLQEFMHHGWPDERLFFKTMGELLRRASKGGRPVRAFGEMVADLWHAGNNSATLRLEQMWNDVCRAQNLKLYCAYPRSGFQMDASRPVEEICTAHSHVLA